MQFIISQILGGIALILVGISYFCNKKTFLLLHTFANIFYGAGFVVSLSFVAGINTFISTLRTIVFFFYERKGKNIPYYYILIFSIMYILVGALLYKSPWDILTTISPIMFTAAMTLRKMITVNFVMLLPNLMLFTFCICNAFYTSCILDAIESIIIIVAIVTYFVRKYREKKEIYKLI